jgi:hypothetical protein
MPRVANNQHRWKISLSDENVTVLEEFADDLQHAWKADSKTPKSYPFATQDLFAEVKVRLEGKLTSESATGNLPPPPPPPRKFADLFDERTIRALYEGKYSDSYDDAIRLAGSGERGSGKAIHRLLKAAEETYFVQKGSDVPAPRIHFLHRQLLEVAQLVGIDVLTNKGLEEFFEDLCPCGKKHNAEAIRKLKDRAARVPKS